jgi:hypothetical protein
MSAYTGSVPDTKRAADWRDEGLCRGRDDDAFFPHPTNATAVQAVKNVCFGCPAMLRCAQYALTRRIPDGVWGGLSEAQRATLLKKHRDADLTELDTVRAAVYTALRKELNPINSLRDLWEDRTYPLSGGHIGWQGESGSFSFRGHVLTPKQLAFMVDRGRKAVGIVRRTCEVVECVNPRHIADNQERYQRKKAAEEAAARAAAQAQYAAAELAS